MAKYDHGGGCPCGLYRYCDPGCRNFQNYGEPEQIKRLNAEQSGLNRHLRLSNTDAVYRVQNKP